MSAFPEADIEVVGQIDAAELCDLYDSVGWSAYTADPAALAEAVVNSTYVVIARVEGRLVGLGRGLSDDVSVFYLQDLLVRPEWQGRGLGRALLGNCLDHFAHVRQKVLLTDDHPEQHRFYESMGYRDTTEPGIAPLHVFVQIQGLDAT